MEVLLQPHISHHRICISISHRGRLHLVQIIINAIYLHGVLINSIENSKKKKRKCVPFLFEMNIGFDGDLSRGFQ